MGVLLVCLVLLTYRLFARTADIGGHASVSWVEFFFLFALYGYIHITALGLGRIIVRRFSLELNGMESTLLAYMLGFGALSMGVALLGFIGWLTPAGVFVVLFTSGLLSIAEWAGIIQSALKHIKTLRFPRPGSVYEALLQILLVAAVPILLVHILTPVWDYDALLYHLEVPRRFIEHGGFYFEQEMMRSAYPYLGEMLFAVGMIFRLDTLSKWIHLTYAVLFVLSVYTFGKRFFNRDASLSAVGILISVPSFILWSTWASIDFAWAGYEFWSVYVVSLWMMDGKDQGKKWMILAGVMSGFAASTKYISIPTLLIVTVLISWVSVDKFKMGLVGIIRNLLIFSVSAGLIMGAWYIKNLILTGNPVYPLVFGGPGWSQLDNQILNDYVGTFGLGKSLSDFIALPYNVYAHQERFSTMPQEIIHPLLWLAFLFPLWANNRKKPFLFVYALLYCILWFFSSQVIRFVLPVSAFLALFAGDITERMPALLKNALKYMLITGLLIYNIIYQTLVLWNSGAFSYIAGQKYAAEFLQVFVEDYRMKQFIEDEIDPTERVIFLWDGRGYYCASRCIPDSEHSAAVGLTIGSPDPTDLARELSDKHITHLMLSMTDANFAIYFHDPNELHRHALDYYKSKFLPVCGEIIFKDGGMELYEITCR